VAALWVRPDRVGWVSFQDLTHRPSLMSPYRDDSQNGFLISFILVRLTFQRLTKPFALSNHSVEQRVQT
jgi:hypothetical protein